MSLFKERKFSFATTENRSSHFAERIIRAPLSLPSSPRIVAEILYSAVNAQSRSRVLRNLTAAQFGCLRHRTLVRKFDLRCSNSI
jgi:hypothetical protein